MCFLKYFLFFLFFFLFFFWVKRFQQKQKDFYKWHCENIYPFHERLTQKEQDYIYNCISLSWYECFNFFYILFDEMILDLSFFSYSHRVKNTKVNSSRIYYGSLAAPQQAFIYAQSVIKERKIKLPFLPQGNYSFGGLGWDCQENHFKVYYRFFDKTKLPDSYQKLILPGEYYPQGIISWTFNKKGNLLEKKVYCYPKKENCKKTYLFSKKRFQIQKDCKYQENINQDTDRLNETGKLICAKYGEKGIFLDTFTFENENDFTLYFP
jgi:hypothetical protein